MNFKVASRRVVHVLTTGKGCQHYRVGKLAKAMVVSYCDT